MEDPRSHMLPSTIATTPMEPTTTWRLLTTRSSEKAPRRRPCLFDRCIFCASLLKVELVCLMSALRYCCFR
uniref:Predicted protein n=1 Tax=Hordeum vulgare subsp. vulgare TaxID=112509 RepID=F2EHI2_HORVV|nr:predicted protein [Hordeum vulgare subsp. vulgare]